MSLYPMPEFRRGMTTMSAKELRGIVDNIRMGHPRLQGINSYMSPYGGGATMSVRPGSRRGAAAVGVMVEIIEYIPAASQGEIVNGWYGFVVLPDGTRVGDDGNADLEMNDGAVKVMSWNPIPIDLRLSDLQLVIPGAYAGNGIVAPARVWNQPSFDMAYMVCEWEIQPPQSARARITEFMDGNYIGFVLSNEDQTDVGSEVTLYATKKWPRADDLRSCLPLLDPAEPEVTPEDYNNVPVSLYWNALEDEWQWQLDVTFVGACIEQGALGIPREFPERPPAPPPFRGAPPPVAPFTPPQTLPPFGQSGVFGGG